MNRNSNFSVTVVFVFLFVLLVPFMVKAEGLRNTPAAVSPGSDTEVVSVWQSCPTFSWSAVDRAASYKLEVFDAAAAQVTSYNDTAAISAPVVSKDIPGPALSWTLSAEESLKTGNMYIWYVRALDSYGSALGNWSNGKIFKVEQELRFAGIEEKLSEVLKSYGMSEETITNVLADIKSDVKEVVVRNENLKDISKGAEGRSGIQGYEGTTNTFYGLNAGSQITTGGGNTFIGSNAGYSNSTSVGNTFIGYSAGEYTTVGSNTFCGSSAGAYNTIGYDNTFIGTGAGYDNTNGYANTFIGGDVGANNTTGYFNTFFGKNAGHQNTEGIENTFIGTGTGYRTTIGSSNTFFGVRAGESNTTGNNNIILGYEAGYSNTTGQSNIFLGYKAGYNETGSNKLYIENSDTSSPLIYGEFDNDIVTVNGKLGIGTKTPDFQVEVETTGQNAAMVTNRTDGATCYINSTSSSGNFGTTTVHPIRMVANSVWQLSLDSNCDITMRDGGNYNGTWNPASSRELKENIDDLAPEAALEALGGLTPVTYNYKADKEEPRVGFIAEDVPELVAMNGRKSLGTVDILAVVTKVVQEQQLLLQKQQDALNEQQKNIAELKEKIDRLENK